MKLQSNLILAFYFLFFLNFQSVAQIRHLRNANEELSKNNFEKVFEKIKKYEKDEGVNAESKYIRSKLLSKTFHELIVLDSAFVFLTEAYSGLENYDQKKKDDLCKEIIFCESNKTIENNEFQFLLFTNYTKEKSIDIIEQFITKYSNNIYFNKAIIVRDSLEFEKIKPLNDEFALNDFLKKRPNSNFYNLAEELMYTVAFDKTKTSNSLEKYKDYIKTYPNSSKINEAIDFVSSKNWEDIESKKNRDLYQKFVADYPTSKFVEQANQKIEEIDWKSTIESDNLSNFEEFVYKYPNSKNIEIANNKIKEYKEIVLPYLNKNKKYTLLNVGTLKFIGEIEYDSMVAMPKGKFIVSKYKKYGVIDLLANKLIPITYDCIQNSGDYFIAKLGKNYGVINDQGQKIIDFSFESINKTENNNFIVSKKINNVNSTYGLISSNGEGILEAIYSNISEIDATTFNVTLNNQSYLIDQNSIIKSQKYNSIIPLDYSLSSNTYYTVELKNKQGIINKKGEIVIPVIYEKITQAGNNFIVGNTIAKSGILYGIIDQKGKVILDLKYKSIDFCGNNLYSINTNTIPKSTINNYKLFSLASNSFLTKESFDSISPISNGLLQVEKNELIGYINELGETVVSPIYQLYGGEPNLRGMDPDGEVEEEICYVSENLDEIISNYDNYGKSELLLVQLNDKIGYINLKGEIIIPIIYLFGSDFYKGMAVVTNENANKSIIDINGDVILDNAEILYYYNNSKYAIAKQEGSFYKIDTETHKTETYTLLKEMDFIDHYKKYKIIKYKDVDVYVTSKDQILMAKGIDFSDYNYKKKVKEARNLYYLGEYDQAINQLKSLLNEKSDVYDVPLLIGKCYKDKGDSYNAIDYFNQAVSIDPNNTEAYNERYELNWKRNYWSDAKNDIIKLINLSSEYDEYLTFNLGYCNSQLNNNKESFENYSKVLKNNPKHSMAYNNRGVIYGSRGEHQMALNDFMSALRNSKYDSDESKGLFLNNVANEFFDLNKKNEACLYWSKGAELGNENCKRNKLYKCK